MCVYLRTKYQVSSIILTSFRLGDDFTSPTPKKPNQIKVKFIFIELLTGKNLLSTLCILNNLQTKYHQCIMLCYIFFIYS